MPSQRKGKIARAPFEVRTAVNQMLRDGAKYSAIITFLESKDVFGVGDQNLTNWQQGGYQEWLAEQDRLSEMQARREFAMQIVKENEGSKLQEATLHLAASQLYEVLSDFDIGGLKELLVDKPENYAAIVNSLAKLSKGALDQQKYRDMVAEQKRKIEEAINEGKSKGGFSTETIEKIERELKLL